MRREFPQPADVVTQVAHRGPLLFKARSQLSYLLHQRSHQRRLLELLLPQRISNLGPFAGDMFEATRTRLHFGLQIVEVCFRGGG